MSDYNDAEKQRYAAEQVQLAQDRIHGLVFPKHEPVYHGDWSDVLVNIDDVFLEQISTLRGDNREIVDTERRRYAIEQLEKLSDDIEAAEKKLPNGDCIMWETYIFEAIARLKKRTLTT